MRTTETPSTVPAPPDELAVRRRRRPLILVAAAAVLVALVGGGLFLGRGGTPAPLPEGDAPTTLALELPPADVARSCIVFDRRMLAVSQVALAGTVADIKPGVVTLEIERWYRGGDADVVTIAVPGQDTSAALDGVDFQEGERYLVTATGGTVNGCGFSGPATPELEQAFDDAFAG